jgi:hypothetical protein
VKGVHEQWYNSMMEKFAEEPDEKSVTEIITVKVEDKCTEIVELLKRKLKSKWLITQEKLEVKISRRLETEIWSSHTHRCKALRKHILKFSCCIVRE